MGFNGKPIADGGLRVVPSLIYVPARGRASAFVVAHAGRSGTGAFAAIVTATGTGGVRVRTPVSYRIWILRDDFDLAGNNDPFATVWFTPTWRETTASAQVPAGTYTLLTELYSNGLTRNRATSITKVDVPVRRPTSVTLDARRTVPATLRTREPTDVRYQMHMFGRRLPYAVISWGYVGFENFPMYVSPTPPARQGTPAGAQRRSSQPSMSGTSSLWWEWWCRRTARTRGSTPTWPRPRRRPRRSTPGRPRCWSTPTCPAACPW